MALAYCDALPENIMLLPPFHHLQVDTGKIKAFVFRKFLAHNGLNSLKTHKYSRSAIKSQKRVLARVSEMA